MTTTDKLAAALRVITDDSRDYESDNAALHAWREIARTALAEYEDRARPLEVGERVRVIGDRHFTPGLDIGSTGTVVRWIGSKTIRVKMDGNGRFVSSDDWGYESDELERIP